MGLQSCASPHMAREEEHFYSGKKEVGKGWSKQRVHDFSLVESSPGKKKISSSCWALPSLQGVRASSSGLQTLFN